MWISKNPNMINDTCANQSIANDKQQDDSTSVIALRKSIIKSLPDLANSDKQSQWWLLGTTGCHLCEVAETLMAQLVAVQPISYHYLDIADFDEELMMQFATTIPVILTLTQQLNYPFSVLDLQQLLV